MEHKNDYGVYVIFTKESMEKEALRDTLYTMASGVEESPELMCLRKCQDRDVADTKRWHVCMKKSIYEGIREHAEQQGIKMYAYRSTQKFLGNGKTYAYFIKYSDEAEREAIRSVFSTLEGKFLRPGTYQIHEPAAYNDGTPRNYLIVSFERKNGYFPRPFIRTLKALINDYVPNETGRAIDVRWCSHSVLRDVQSGVTK